MWGWKFWRSAIRTDLWSGSATSRDYGVEAMAADDLNTYKPVVERLGIDHQICIAHVEKWARDAERVWA